MALTAAVLSSANVKPKDVAYLSIGTGNTVGVALSLDATAPANGITPQIAEIRSDTDFYWSYQDTQTAADGTMVKQLAREVLRVEVGAAGLNIYMKASTGTAKMSVVQV